ncbi:MAG: hypothetical protein ABIG10_01920 [bacterium]
MEENEIIRSLKKHCNTSSDFQDLLKERIANQALIAIKMQPHISSSRDLSIDASIFMHEIDYSKISQNLFFIFFKRFAINKASKLLAARIIEKLHGNNEELNGFTIFNHKFFVNGIDKEIDILPRSVPKKIGKIIAKELLLKFNIIKFATDNSYNKFGYKFIRV